jgi:hypothetical protein
MMLAWVCNQIFFFSLAPRTHAGKLVYKITNLGLDVYSGPGAVITFDLKKDR